jgi:hypothetical protein
VYPKLCVCGDKPFTGERTSVSVVDWVIDWVIAGRGVAIVILLVAALVRMGRHVKTFTQETPSPRPALHRAALDQSLAGLSLPGFMLAGS